MSYMSAFTSISNIASIQMLLSVDVEVSEACKMCLLDYLCIHNSKEEFKNIPTMEKWYNEGNLTVWELQKLSKLNLQSSWRKGGEAELLFEEMKEKSAQAYCTLIKGMAKVRQFLHNFLIMMMSVCL